MGRNACAKSDDRPHHVGHRERLRERFLNGGADTLPDYELMELVLFAAIPRRDVKPLAKELIARFGNFSGVVNAPVGELVRIKGISRNTAVSIKIIHQAAVRMMKQDIIGKEVLNSWQRLIDYCYATMACERKENFRLLFLNKNNRLIADEVQQSGTIDHTPAYPREVIKRALELEASAIVLVHNHPSGDPHPSQDDVDITNSIMDAAKPFGIKIHDHLIISKGGITSFKDMGLL